LIADDPFDDAVTWEEKFSEINSKLRGGVETQENIITLPNSNTNLPSNKKSVEQVILGLPDWFKTTAGWWAQDKITDEEFKKNIQFLVTRGIIRPYTSDVLQKIINEEETLLEKSLQKLGEQVMFLRDSQELTNDDVKKLLKKLDLTKTKFDFDNMKGGCKQLDGFIDSTSGLVDQSKINQKTGQSLINSADLIKFNYCTN